MEAVVPKPFVADACVETPLRKILFVITLPSSLLLNVVLVGITDDGEFGILKGGKDSRSAPKGTFCGVDVAELAEGSKRAGKCVLILDEVFVISTLGVGGGGTNTVCGCVNVLSSCLISMDGSGSVTLDGIEEAEVKEVVVEENLSEKLCCVFGELDREVTVVEAKEGEIKIEFCAESASALFFEGGCMSSSTGSSSSFGS